MLLAAPDLVLALDVDKILAGNARILERLYIVGDAHRSEHVVGAVGKPGETPARPCSFAVVAKAVYSRLPLKLHDWWACKG